MSKFSKKRRVERIRVGLPVRAKVANLEAVVLDLSFMGCRVEHSSALRVGSTVKLGVFWHSQPIEFECHVIRCTLDTRSQQTATHYQSGLLFSKGLGDATATLRNLIVLQVIEALEEQKANAHGELPKWLLPDAAWKSYQGEEEHVPFTSLPYLKVARSRGYVSYVLNDRGRWAKKRTSSPDQPDDGFTIWAYEDEEQAEQLAKTYAAADSNLKSLIRFCAELSLQVDDSLPPQRFEP